MNFFSIDTGFFSTEAGAMFGIMSQKVWSKKYPADRENRSPLSMRCLFVDFGERKVLFDTGVGNKQLRGMAYYRFRELIDIRDALKSKGYDAMQITDVVLSHLHFDHCGGCTREGDNGELELCFPRARHWASTAQWKNSLQPSSWEADAYLPENMQAVKDAGKLHLIDKDQVLFPGLELKLYQGHTYDQIVSFIRTERGNLIFSGDVVPMATHIAQGCIAAVDNHALLAVEEKMRLLEEACELQAGLVFYHDFYTKIAGLKKSNGRIWEAASPLALD